MAQKNQGGTATLSPPKPQKLDVADATFPVRMLHAVGMAFNQNTRYAMSSLLIRSRDGAGGAKADALDVVATDGRRIIIVKHDTDLYSGKVNIIVPGDVARNALRVASKSEDEEPTATITQNKNAFTLTVSTTSGSSVFSWKTDGDSLPFPAYEDVLPDFRMFGTSEIGVNPEGMARTLQVVTRIIGPDHNAKLFMPGKAGDPLGMEATDGETIEITAVVMPAPIGDWTKTDEKKDAAGDRDQQELYDAWRNALVDELDVSDAVKARLNLAFPPEGDGTVAKLGPVFDWKYKLGNNWTDIDGLTAGQGGKLGDAVEKYVKDHKITLPSKPATPAELERDQVQEGLMVYLEERFVSVGVTREQHQDPKLGQKMDELLLAKLMTPAQAMNVRKTFEDPALTTADVQVWFNGAKAKNDDAYRAAATEAGVKLAAGGAAAIAGKDRKHRLPS